MIAYSQLVQPAKLDLERSPALELRYEWARAPLPHANSRELPLKASLQIACPRRNPTRAHVVRWSRCRLVRRSRSRCQYSFATAYRYVRLDLERDASAETGQLQHSRQDNSKRQEHEQSLEP